MSGEDDLVNCDMANNVGHRVMLQMDGLAFDAVTLKKWNHAKIPADVLSQLLLADVRHWAFMSKQELSYRVMDLPVVRWTCANVDVVGFYCQLYLTLSVVDKQTTVFLDHTEYSGVCRELLR